MKRWLLIACGGALLCGCVDESVQGETTVWTFAWWVPLAALVLAGAGGAIGWRVRKQWRRVGYGLLIGAGLTIPFLAPMLMRDRVTVDAERFTLRTGFWFYPTRHDVRFDDLSRIELQETKRWSRTGRRVTYTLLCVRRRGGPEPVPIGTLMEYAVEKILDTATNQGVEILDKR
jgi:hypothetical protein